MRIAVLASLLVAACVATPTPPTTLEAVGRVRPDVPMPKGYLEPRSLPDSLALLPPPPEPGSPAQAADLAAFQAALGASSERFARAAQDADLRWPAMAQSFAELLGVSFAGGALPHTAMLLQRSAMDAGLSTYAAKEHYRRTRPFVAQRVNSCTPAEEAALAQDGSYPSGHSAVGWMLALVLTDLAPDRADALLRRGLDFGESRIVCRVHWRSDVEAGRLMAAATFARLQSDPVFQAQRERARRELANARGRS
ncbi:MAG: phosphatase PAP2 family protein [Sphingomonadaceae bacterium]|uniref:acid phosphatase n=1 Tax=Thermaurantiacus sp. TaxID=2820283 RepID=UPI00298EFF45|nr:phosphatase PAP2 family protein [Thermaurantiacus sp.]MCS6987344.1 phosphatase PAP2 family protein [Sphingomonadaceae bacterium]MDW8414565.1 phosphatase PAP2 family protein [Thermaurantiacus sp.]